MEKNSDLRLCAEVNGGAVSLLESGKWSDCTFLVGFEPHQEVIGGHRLILAMASHVFEAMFYGTIAEIQFPIFVVDITPDIFKTMLKYIYTGQLQLNSIDEACSMCYTAEKYELHHLLRECITHLYTELNPRNACQIYEIAQLINQQDLMQNCMQLIVAHTKEALNDSSLEDLMPSTIITILSLDDLHIDTELDLVDAVIRYANADNSTSTEGTAGHREGINVSPNGNGSSASTDGINVNSTKRTVGHNSTKRKADIRRMVEKLRLLTLTPQQFAESSLPSLLTEAECLAVLMNLTLNNSNVPMPSGLSTSRMGRTEGRLEGTFRFTIEDFTKTNDPMVCPPRYVRYLPWQLTAMKTQSEDQPTTLGLFLTCNYDIITLKQSCYAAVEFRLVSNKPDTNHFCRKIEHVFTEKEQQCGFDDFMVMDDVLDSAKGYINNGAIILEVHISPEQPCYLP